MFRPLTVLLFCFVLLPSFAFIIVNDPSNSDHLVPGDKFAFNITVQPGDHLLVSINLVIPVNTSVVAFITNIFANTTLVVDVTTLVFPIPLVAPGPNYALEISDPSTRGFWKLSPSFEIFAPASNLTTTTSQSLSSFSTSSSLSTASTPTSSSTSSPASSPTTVGAQANTKSHKTIKVGPIVGGVSAVVVLIIIAIIFQWRRRLRKNTPTNETENALPNAAPETRLGSIQPFVLPRSNGASLLPETFIPNRRVTLEGANPWTGPSKVSPARAEFLSWDSQERVRISRDSESASPEHRSPSAVSSFNPLTARAPPVPMDSAINDQLESLREQIRQIEARQMQGPSEPPPGYDGFTPSRMA